MDGGDGDDDGLLVSFVSVIATILGETTNKKQDGPTQQLSADGFEGGQSDREGIFHVVFVSGLPYQWPQGQATQRTRRFGGARVSVVPSCLRANTSVE